MGDHQGRARRAQGGVRRRATHRDPRRDDRSHHRGPARRRGDGGHDHALRLHQADARRGVPEPEARAARASRAWRPRKRTSSRTSSSPRPTPILLFFTNKGKVHWLKVHEIPEGGRQAKGKAIVNVLSLAEGEAVATCVPVRDFESGGYILFATKQGTVKKTELVAVLASTQRRHPRHHAGGGRRGHGGAAHRRPARGAALDQGRA